MFLCLCSKTLIKGLCYVNLRCRGRNNNQKGYHPNAGLTSSQAQYLNKHQLYAKGIAEDLKYYHEKHQTQHITAHQKEPYNQQQLYASTVPLS